MSAASSDRELRDRLVSWSVVPAEDGPSLSLTGLSAAAKDRSASVAVSFPLADQPRRDALAASTGAMVQSLSSALSTIQRASRAGAELEVWELSGSGVVEVRMAVPQAVTAAEKQ